MVSKIFIAIFLLIVIRAAFSPYIYTKKIASDLSKKQKFLILGIAITFMLGSLLGAFLAIGLSTMIIFDMFGLYPDRLGILLLIISLFLLLRPLIEIIFWFLASAFDWPAEKWHKLLKISLIFNLIYFFSLLGLKFLLF